MPQMLDDVCDQNKVCAFCHCQLTNKIWLTAYNNVDIYQL